MLNKMRRSLSLLLVFAMLCSMFAFAAGAVDDLDMELRLVEQNDGYKVVVHLNSELDVQVASFVLVYDTDVVALDEEHVSWPTGFINVPPKGFDESHENYKAAFLTGTLLGSTVTLSNADVMTVPFTLVDGKTANDVKPDTIKIETDKETQILKQIMASGARHSVTIGTSDARYYLGSATQEDHIKLTPKPDESVFPNAVLRELSEVKLDKAKVTVEGYNASAVTQTVQATANDNTGRAITDVDWSVALEGSAASLEVNTLNSDVKIDANGVITIGNNADGTYVVKATQGKIEKTASLQVEKAPATGHSIQIVGDTEITLASGESKQLSASATDQFNRPEPNITWSCEEEPNLVNDSGLVKVTDEIPGGVYTVTAACGSATATVTVTVKGTTKIEITGANTVTYGDTIDLSATVYENKCEVDPQSDTTVPANDNGYDITNDVTITWNAAPAGKITLDSTTGAAVKATGDDIADVTITVRATSDDHQAAKATHTLTVAKRPITVKIDDQIITDGDPIDGSKWKIDSGSLVEGDDLGITLTAPDTTVGTHENGIIGISTNAKYDVTFINGKLTVDPKPVESESESESEAPVNPSTPSTSGGSSSSSNSGWNSNISASGRPAGTPTGTETKKEDVERTADIPAEVTDGVASASVGTSNVNGLLNNTSVLVLDVNGTSGANSAIVTIDADATKAIAGKSVPIRIETAIGSLELSGDDMKGFGGGSLVVTLGQDTCTVVYNGSPFTSELDHVATVTIPTDRTGSNLYVYLVEDGALDADGNVVDASKLQMVASGRSVNSGMITFNTRVLGNFLISEIDYLSEGAVNAIAFVDVPASHWAKSAINDLASRGIVAGMGNGTFAPDAPVTREQFVRMLAGVANKQPTATASRFTDVSSTAWSVAYIEWAADEGITVGKTPTTFAPTAAISRQEMASMIYRYVQNSGKQLPEKNGEIQFTDSDSIGAWAAESVTAMQKAGIINGVASGSGYAFRPTSPASRAECAAMLSALLKIL